MREGRCCVASAGEEIAALFVRSKGYSSFDQWQKAATFSQLLKSGVNASRIARETGCSVTMVLEYANAFNVFQNSVQKLPFTYYRYAAKTADPEKWIKMAVERNLTSRELDREIKKEQKKKTTGKCTVAQAQKTPNSTR